MAKKSKAEKTKTPRDPKERAKRFGALFLATGLYSGYLPIAPGTFGTVVAVGLVWLIQGLPLWVYLILTAITFAAGVWASGEANKIFGKADARYIVIDEIVGFLITMIAIPVTAKWLIWGFVLFRVFDVVKPPPANYFDQRVKSGLGVVMDDVVAGIYGNVLLHLMIRASL
jgi:phosphatidylglycerophosphatase A